MIDKVIQNNKYENIFLYCFQKTKCLNFILINLINKTKIKFILSKYHLKSCLINRSIRSIVGVWNIPKIFAYYESNAKITNMLGFLIS